MQSKTNILSFPIGGAFLVTVVLSVAAYSLEAQDETSKPEPPMVYREVSDTISFGSEPTGIRHLRSLHARGVRVIVSVDSARPHVEDAKSLGLRVVHIPTQYSGFSTESLGGLVRIGRETNEKVYVHCHHGKHRGPTAAMIIALSKGILNTEKALSIMADAGTGKEYKGLWEAVRKFNPADDFLPLPNFFEEQPADLVAEQMLIADESLEFLKLYVKSSSGQEKREQASHKLLLLRESFAESQRFSDPDAKDLNDRYANIWQHVESMRESLDGNRDINLSKQVERLEASCKSCHEEHRNN